MSEAFIEALHGDVVIPNVEPGAALGLFSHRRAQERATRDLASGRESRAWWQEQGYVAGKEIGEGLWIVLAEMMYTWRLMICDPETSSIEFYCYPKEQPGLAMIAYQVWDGKNVPPEGWTRHHS